MAESWTLNKLGDLCEAIFSGGTPRTSDSTFWNGNLNWLSSGETRNLYIRETDRKITQLGAFNSSTKMAICGDVVIASAGQGSTRGQVSFCLVETYINQSIIAIRSRRESLYPKFLLYCLLDRYEELRSISDADSSRGSLTCRLLENLPIYYPSLPSQRKIAAILSAYDDLIEKNTRRIKILDEIAQNLYREWFVKFRFPGHEHARFVDSPLGRIPEGWYIREMQEVADVIDCLHSKKPQHNESGKGLLLQLSNIGDGGIIDLSKKYLLDEEDYKKWTSRVEVQFGDCVITNVGRVGAVAQIPKGLKAAIGRNMTAIRPHTNIMGPTYLIQYLLSPLMEREIQIKMDAGSIMDSLNVKGIIKLSVPIATPYIMKQFESIARPLREHIELLIKKNTTLRTTRDLLSLSSSPARWMFQI